MRMRITAPAVVNGAPKSIGDVVDVTEPGEAARLAHYGQAVEDTDDAPDTTAGPGGWTTPAEPGDGEASNTPIKENA